MSGLQEYNLIQYVDTGPDEKESDLGPNVENQLNIEAYNALFAKLEKGQVAIGDEVTVENVNLFVNSNKEMWQVVIKENLKYLVIPSNYEELCMKSKWFVGIFRLIHVMGWTKVISADTVVTNQVHDAFLKQDLTIIKNLHKTWKKYTQQPVISNDVKRWLQRDLTLTVMKHLHTTQFTSGANDKRKQDIPIDWFQGLSNPIRSILPQNNYAKADSVKIGNAVKAILNYARKEHIKTYVSLKLNGDYLTKSVRPLAWYRSSIKRELPIKDGIWLPQEQEQPEFKKKIAAYSKHYSELDKEGWKDPPTLVNLVGIANEKRELDSRCNVIHQYGRMRSKLISRAHGQGPRDRARTEEAKRFNKLPFLEKVKTWSISDLSTWFTCTEFYAPTGNNEINLGNLTRCTNVDAFVAMIKKVIAPKLLTGAKANAQSLDGIFLEMVHRVHNNEFGQAIDITQVIQRLE